MTRTEEKFNEAFGLMSMFLSILFLNPYKEALDKYNIIGMILLLIGVFLYGCSIKLVKWNKK